jgi:hypothetical protein
MRGSSGNRHLFRAPAAGLAAPLGCVKPSGRILGGGSRTGLPGDGPGPDRR